MESIKLPIDMSTFYKHSNETIEENIDVNNLTVDDEVLGTSGLYNMGNTCYMNSIVQCLSNCSLFREYILSNEFIPNIIKDKNIPSKNYLNNLEQFLSFQLRKIIVNIWNSSFYAFRPISFRKLFGKKIEMFQNSAQHDSQEALLCILDTFNEEIGCKIVIEKKNNSIACELLKNLIENDDESSNLTNLIRSNQEDYINYMSSENFVNFYKNKYSKISDIFSGRTISELECPVTGAIKVNFEPFFFLSISLPDDDDESDMSYNSSNSNKSAKTSSSKSAKTSSSESSKSNSSSPTYCDVCNKDMQSLQSFEEHCNGRKHKNKLVRINRNTNDTSSDNLFLNDKQLQQNKVNDLISPDNSTEDKSIDEFLIEKSNEVMNYMEEDNSQPKDKLQDTNSDEGSETEELYDNLYGIYDEYGNEDEDGDEDGDEIEDEDEVKDEDENEDNDSNDEKSDNESQLDEEESSDDDISKYYHSLRYNSFNTNNLRNKQNKRKKMKEFDLSECLSNFIKPEILDDENMWYSPFAKKKVNATKNISIWESPKILIIHLKRFKKNMYGSVEKLTNKVNFPIEGLDISEYLHNSSNCVNKLYDLFAINNHTNFNKFGFGGISFGHYYSYCKNITNNKWYNYNDESVNEISIDNIISNEAYILFYKLRE